MANNDMLSCTDIKVTKCSCTWTINNFSLISKAADKLKSHTFCAEDNIDNLKWCLWFNMKLDRDNISLHLQLASAKSKVAARYKIYTLNAKSEKTNLIQRHAVEIFTMEMGLQDRLVGYIKRDLSDKFCEDKLIIICEIGVAGDIVNNVVRFKEPECTLCEDLGNMFVSERFSDLTITVAGREYRTHKNILAARSEVFSAMFKHEMEELKQNRVDITDVDPDVLKEMLRFIYTGNVSAPDKMTVALLAAADKYALEQLKVMCEKALYVKLSVETAAETLVLADLHSAYKLKANTIYFINTHSTDVVKTKGWKNMLTTHSHLISELYEALASR